MITEKASEKGLGQAVMQQSLALLKNQFTSTSKDGAVLGLQYDEAEVEMTENKAMVFLSAAQ